MTKYRNRATNDVVEGLLYLPKQKTHDFTAVSSLPCATRQTDPMGRWCEIRIGDTWKQVNAAEVIWYDGEEWHVEPFGDFIQRHEQLTV